MRSNGIPYENGVVTANTTNGVVRANAIVNADAIINGFVIVDNVPVSGSGITPNGVTRANGVVRANYINFTTDANGVVRANVVIDNAAYPFANISLAPDLNGVVRANVVPDLNSQIENGVVRANGEPVVNSALFDGISNSGVVVILDESDIARGYVEGYISINTITGLTVTNNENPHSIIPGAYLPVASGNYIIEYEPGDLTVNKAPLTVTAENKDIQYGNEVTLTSTVSGYVKNQETDIDDDISIFGEAGITHEVRKADNTIVTGPIYPVGSYSIRSVFNDPANYEVTSINGTLNVGKKDLIVTMGSPVYYFTEGQPVPVFSSTTDPAGVVSNDLYTIRNSSNAIVSANNLTAGVYSVFRNINSTNLVDFSSYNIIGTPSALYVNPSGGNTKAIRPVLVCIEPLENPIDGLTFRARYAYENLNKTIIYVPLGEENQIILSPGAEKSGNPPELFLPGTHEFYILFNGTKITWLISSVEKNKKSSSSSEASSTSNKCNSNGPITLAASSRAVPVEVTGGASIFPNPASSQLMIVGDFSKVTERDVIVVDVLGRQVRPASIRKQSSQRMIFDIGNLSNSQYFIRINGSSGGQVFKFIKQ